MAGLPRKTAFVWGGNLTPNGNIGKPGSLAAGGEIYSSDLAVLQAGAWLNGWAQAIVGTDSPVLEEFNGILFTITQQIAYILERGVPEFDANTTYNLGDVIKPSNSGTIYTSLQDGNLNHAPPNTNWWRVLGTDLFDVLGAAATAEAAAVASAEAYTDLKIGQIQPLVAQAYVVFDGAGNIIREFNVASVIRTSAGKYTINFSSNLSNAFPIWSGNCGAASGSPAAGSNNVLIGTAAPSASQLFVGSWESNLTVFEDPDRVTIIVI